MATDHRNWTALHYAAYNGHPKVVNFLVKFEADKDQLFHVKNSQGKTAFIIAKNDAVKKAFNHIWKSCKIGDLDMVRVLLREGEDENRKTQDNENTPMHVAAYNGHYLIVKYLMEDKGAKHDL